MVKTWGGIDPSDDPKGFQNYIEQGQKYAAKGGNKPPPKPTAMFRWLHPKEAKEIDTLRATFQKNKNWRGKERRKNKRK